MSRPRKCRQVNRPPHSMCFRPDGIETSDLLIYLTLDEYEAVRLADYEGLDQEEASRHMEISRPTFTRLIESARRKMATFFVEGIRLEIEGGVVHFRKNLYLCKDCGAETVVSIDQTVDACPVCGSVRLDDRALRYGHGLCCRKKMHKNLLLG